MTDDTAPTARPSLGPAYRRLWVSGGLSNLADGILKVALPLAAIALTRSPALVAGVTVAFTLPWLLFALPAGAIVDRLDRRRAMLVANLTRAALLGLLAAALAFDLGSIWALYVVAFGVGIAETIYDTAAQSIVPQLVPRDLLPRANGRLYAVELTANQFVGPPLAGVLVAVGAALAMATPAGLWVVAVGALLLVRGSFRINRAGPRTTLRADIAEGLRFLWRNRLLRAFAAMVGTFNFATNAVMAVFVLYAVGPASAMRLSEQAFGLLLATMAIGSLTGSLIAERVERLLGRARSLLVSIIGGALLVGVAALTANVYAISAAFFIGSAGIVVWNVIVVSLRQRITPAHLLGRINSGHRLVAWGSMPLGAAVGGVLAEYLGLRAVFAVMALVLLTLLAWLRVTTDAAMTEATEAADALADSADSADSAATGPPR